MRNKNNCYIVSIGIRILWILCWMRSSFKYNFRLEYVTMVETNFLLNWPIRLAFLSTSFHQYELFCRLKETQKSIEIFSIDDIRKSRHSAIARKLKLHVGIRKRHESKRGINRCGEGRKVEHNGAWNEERLIFRVDDTTTYIRVCIRMFAVNAVARKRSINQFAEQSASAQAERAVPRSRARETSFVRTNASFFFLYSSSPPFFLPSNGKKKGEKEKHAGEEDARTRERATGHV